ncbi:Putative 115 kDa protein in type-1 retrotransposable element R1DM [Eumeta japonica]|uniref:115 kDa protein in type-1 retrotransposable element R1DM n=1 Tax=Eumeta variegata TaxID=151549 RepID=A0A4C1YZJ6_EUMVA|nr:Putative 115 kDa protein in type-1 retrotransposable element R1DM [Eumeta japonica]
MDACNRVGNNKAPELDGISNIALKTAIKVAPTLFIETYDTCLKEPCFPTKDAIAGTRGRTKKYCLVATLDIRNAFKSANWDCIMWALEEKNIPKYLCGVVASYFTNRVLKYDTEKGSKEYKITYRVPQGSVLDPLLWNIMYDGLLKVLLPTEVKHVAYADDVAVVIVAKHLDQKNLAFDKAFERISHWIDTVNLPLAKYKTEALLITSRKKAETIKLQVGEQEITSQPYNRYLGVMIDARVNFKQQVEHVSAKSSAVRASLARLIPNVGGPKQSKRLLLSSVVTSVLTYGISIWSDVLEIQKSWRKAEPVYRLSALRVTGAFRTISEEAVCVISGILSLGVLVEERQTLCQRKRTSTLSAEELRKEERQISICQWQLQWDAAKKGRWMHRLIPQIDVRLNHNHDEVNCYSTQILSGCGCFRAYLHRFKREDSPECPFYLGEPEDAEHLFFLCPRFNPQRDELVIILNQRIQPEILVEVMLSTKAARNATSTFSTEVLTNLRSIERRRARDSN